MNIILLVDALMLGVALALPGRLGGYESALNVIARFNGEGTGNDLYNKWCVSNYGPYAPSYSDDQCGWSMYISFTSQSTRAAALLGGSILCIVTVYTCFSITSFSGPDEKTSRTMLTNWWKVVQFAVLSSVFLTAVGIMYIFGTVKMVATFAYADFFLDSSGKYKYVDSSNNPKNTVNYYNDQSWGWPVSFFLFGIISVSLGLALKSRALRQAYIEINSGGELSEAPGVAVKAEGGDGDIALSAVYSDVEKD